MLSLVSSLRKKTTSHSNTEIMGMRAKWQQLSQQGHHFHQHRRFKKAIEYFKESLLISKQLRYVIPKQATEKYGLQLFYFSSHNLAASYNAHQESALAKEVLLDLHNTLIDLLTSPYQARELRLEALANLDKSLFSLASQLAYMNQVNDIHETIRYTENIASATSKDLL